MGVRISTSIWCSLISLGESWPPADVLGDSDHDPSGWLDVSLTHVEQVAPLIEAAALT